MVIVFGVAYVVKSISQGGLPLENQTDDMNSHTLVRLAGGSTYAVVCAYSHLLYLQKRCHDDRARVDHRVVRLSCGQNNFMFNHHRIF